MPEQRTAKEPPKNFSYEYRGILHVEDPLKVSNEEEWQESVRQKYRDIDSGKFKRPMRDDPMTDLKTASELSRFFDKMSKNQDGGAENDALRGEVEELKGVVNDLIIKLSKDDDARRKEAPAPAVGPVDGVGLTTHSMNYVEKTPKAAEDSGKIEPETPASVGSGECPTCKKQFKRLDMHVCKEA